ncbi:MAG: acyl carrier protein [Candidatus Sericytochromatia bacterium]|nr:acyl carrier protein [Candidatus Sericytochromatia bacterium]
MTAAEDEIVAEIRRVVESELAMPLDVRPTDRLIEDLGLDSLTLTTLAVALEDRFEVILSDEAATRIQTVGELAACVAERRRPAP